MKKPPFERGDETDAALRRLERALAENPSDEDALLELCKARERLDGAAAALEARVRGLCLAANGRRATRTLSPDDVADAVGKVARGVAFASMADGASDDPRFERRRDTGFEGPSTVAFACALLDSGPDGPLGIGVAEAGAQTSTWGAISEAWHVLGKPVSAGAAIAWIEQASERRDCAATTREVARRWTVLREHGLE